ncbi:hypothetical protein [Mucilaginibacter kameinonensis]|uniref:hypothetical protein n=1 Tax=Mucilaginibacter kameinonensis TaxID=452286 RepID=UPI000EF7E1D7|nr:hypothetical protein [Mucilaginibacter kameinonensis]
MSLITPVQYCFPYFFDEYDFKSLIEQMGLQYKLSFDTKTRLFNSLSIFNNHNFNFFINCFTNLMFDQNGDLIIWKTEEDVINFSKIKTNYGLINKIDFTIELKGLHAGKDELGNNYGLSNFVTYVRKSSINYDFDYAENFAIVIINNSSIDIIPFDWFNKKGGDYGYVWPATAQLNLGTFELTGKGMRMENFSIQLHNQI